MPNIRELRSTLTLLRKITKHGVFLLMLLCTIYCGLMYLGVDLFGIHLILFGFALVLRLILSKTFGLCRLHKMCVIYIFFVSLCVATLRHNIVTLLGWNIRNIQAAMMIVGVILCILVAQKAFWQTCDNCDWDNDNNSR